MAQWPNPHAPPARRQPIPPHPRSFGKLRPTLTRIGLRRMSKWHSVVNGSVLSIVYYHGSASAFAASSRLVLTSIRFTPAQYHRPNPARIVFLSPILIDSTRARLMAISLIIHSPKRQRFHPPTLGDMKIRVLVPTHHMQKEFADHTGGLWRQLAGREIQRHFITAVQQLQFIVGTLNQFIHRSVARAPA